MASTVIEAGAVITGAVVSTTLTWNVPLLVLPDESWADTVTVVTPSGNCVPLAWE